MGSPTPGSDSETINRPASPKTTRVLNLKQLKDPSSSRDDWPDTSTVDQRIVSAMAAADSCAFAGYNPVNTGKQRLQQLPIHGIHDKTPSVSHASVPIGNCRQTNRGGCSRKMEGFVT
ncbi:MAG: hypothetical protein ACPHL6_11955 [Rubripirellula sp.]